MRFKWLPAVAGFLDKLDTKLRAVFYLEYSAKLECSVSDLFAAAAAVSVPCVTWLGFRFIQRTMAFCPKDREYIVGSKILMFVGEGLQQVHRCVTRTHKNSGYGHFDTPLCKHLPRRVLWRSQSSLCGVRAHTSVPEGHKRLKYQSGRKVWKRMQRRAAL